MPKSDDLAKMAAGSMCGTVIETTFYFAFHLFVLISS